MGSTHHGNICILSPLFFLIYINNFPGGLNSNVNIFADDTSVFSVVNDLKSSADTLNSLFKIHEQTDQWKMDFNANNSIYAAEVLF